MNAAKADDSPLHLPRLTVPAFLPRCGGAGATSSLYIVGEKGRAQLVRGEIVNRVNGVTVDAFKPKDGFTFSSV